MSANFDHAALNLTLREIVRARAAIAIPASRPIDDVDLRDREPDEAQGEPGDIEVAMFCEGEYTESVFVSRDRALELYRQLGTILGIQGVVGVHCE